MITVFSAPNYCGEYNNKGAVILIENEKMNIKQYKDVDHPFHLPGQIDLFKWSIPFLVDKIADMIKVISTRSSKGTPTPNSNEIANADFSLIINAKSLEVSDESRKYRIIKTKLIAIARFSRILRTIR